MGANPFITYANKQATRNLPLNDRLTNAMSFLPELGVRMEVFSGGQLTKAQVEALRKQGKKAGRVGSVRHDHGNAADVFFYNKDGRKLDWARPEDRPIFEEIVRRGKAAGVTGFGAGPGYMQQGSMHLGFGTPAVWGAGGSSANAPAWLKAAYNGAKLGTAPAAAASASGHHAGDGHDHGAEPAQANNVLNPYTVPMPQGAPRDALSSDNAFSLAGQPIDSPSFVTPEEIPPPGQQRNVLASPSMYVMQGYQVPELDLMIR